MYFSFYMLTNRFFLILNGSFLSAILAATILFTIVKGKKKNRKDQFFLIIIIPCIKNTTLTIIVYMNNMLSKLMVSKKNIAISFQLKNYVTLMVQ